MEKIDNHGVQFLCLDFAFFLGMASRSDEDQCTSRQVQFKSCAIYFGAADTFSVIIKWNSSTLAIVIQILGP